MDERDRLAERFEEQRGQLRAVAYRMLGSHSEAEDAVQEAWLRLARIDPAQLDNLPAWLRVVVTRICLDMLRSRSARYEDLRDQLPDDSVPADARAVPGGAARRSTDPEEEALLADSVSRALLVVLDTLDPAERVAFVLHDMFAVPFAQIAPIVERTPAATKKLASRARQKVQGTPTVPAALLARQRRVVSAFLEAARAGDLAGVLGVLAPDVVSRADAAARPPGTPAVVRGARAVAEGTVLFAARSRLAELALVNGTVGLIVAPGGRLWLALTFTVEGDKITEYTVIAAPEHLSQLSLAVLS
ncbi:MAG: sigma-70 family RNA polymerase sigma factor [Streptosporangiaceae bacterium]|nr:sigma-70 family RNA polymerase sigma factor [Streptosporangiaceae bacterium]